MDIPFTFSVDGTATNATSVVASDPTGTFGVKRSDTGGIVVADGTAFTNTSPGVYALTVTEPAYGLTYLYWVEWVYGGKTYRVNGSMVGTIPTSTGLGLYNALYRRIVADATIAAIVGTRINNGFGLDGDQPQIQIDIDQVQDDSLDVWACKNFAVDVKIVCSTVESRETLRRLVFALLNRQQWSDDSAGVSVSSSMLTNENSYQQSISGDVEKLYYTTDQSYNFIAQET